MTPEYLSPLANHLWQSTIVAGIAALLTLILRKNSAGVRDWLWFVAASKFLIPFSLLVSIGHQFEWREPFPIALRPVSTVTEIGMPFVVSPIEHVGQSSAPGVNPVPVILFSVWLCG